MNLSTIFGGKEPAPPELCVDVVPGNAWWPNLSLIVTKEHWDTIRRAAYRRAGYSCVICGGKSSKYRKVEWPVECHEVWQFEENSLLQKLEDFVALCSDCHAVKHHRLGRPPYQFRPYTDEQMVDHLCTVNRWDRAKAKDHFLASIQEVARLTQLVGRWTLDLTTLVRFKIPEDYVRCLASNIVSGQAVRRDASPPRQHTHRKQRSQQAEADYFESVTEDLDIY